ncbi:hypothetical protein AAK882_05270 [Carnobacteriaceae bacterium 52-44]
MTRKQDIVPVKLRDDRQSINSPQRKPSPQKLVARLKSIDTELFVYEGIRESLLKVLLTELNSHETR